MGSEAIAIARRVVDDLEEMIKSEYGGTSALRGHMDRIRAYRDDIDKFEREQRGE